jgi:MspA
MHDGIGRIGMGLVAAVVALFVSTGTSHAALDNELSVVDGGGRTMVIQQWDTFLDGVFPLDRNRLTREWFHSGRAIYHVTGPGADRSRARWNWGIRSGSRGRWVWG